MCCLGYVVVQASSVRTHEQRRREQLTVHLQRTSGVVFELSLATRTCALTGSEAIALA